MTDQEIIQKLIARDNRVTDEFFFKHCRPVFLSIIRKVFNYEVNYDEFINELYVHIMEDDARRLKTFHYNSSVFQWIKIVALNYFIKKRNRMIENQSKEPLVYEKNHQMTSETAIGSNIDTERLFSAMPNKRYTYVLRKLLIEDMAPEELAVEMNINTDNLYNIKKRALHQLTQIAIKDIKNYEKH